jgi:hypothetical protein
MFKHCTTKFLIFLTFCSKPYKLKFLLAANTYVHKKVQNRCIKPRLKTCKKLFRKVHLNVIEKRNAVKST